MTMMSLPSRNKSSVLSRSGESFVNMRDLDSQRVLVLANGKRWTTGINGSTDLSNIPAALIDRIEVLKDSNGQSTQYSFTAGTHADRALIVFIANCSCSTTTACRMPTRAPGPTTTPAQVGNPAMEDSAMAGTQAHRVPASVTRIARYSQSFDGY
jgi:hypothetical protein